MKDIKFRQSLFWDTDPKKIDKKKNAKYIIERVLEFGNLSEAKWLFQKYKKNKIKEVMNLPRAQISKKSKSLWSIVLK